MALQGTLDTFALPDVLRLLAATHKTGRLRITGSRGTGSVWVDAGLVAALEATHAPHATELVDSLFELLRFTDGAFTFDAEARHEHPGPPTEVELLLAEAELLLEEWKQIEVIVPSLDAWVSLRPALPGPSVMIDQTTWTTVVAVGDGATVRRIADELCLGEMAVSRTIKDLVALGILSVDASAPAGAVSVSSALAAAPVAAPVDPLVPLGFEPEPEPEPIPEVETAPRGPRATTSRRAGDGAEDEPIAGEPPLFVPLELPGHAPVAAAADPHDVDDDLAAAFPGLTDRLPAAPSQATHTDDVVDDDDDEVSRQLATLSPRAASAVRAAAEATTGDERDAALEGVDADGEPVNRGLLLKFLSSVQT